jgi:hypothetical protein
MIIAFPLMPGFPYSGAVTDVNYLKALFPQVVLTIAFEGDQIYSGGRHCSAITRASHSKTWMPAFREPVKMVRTFLPLASKTAKFSEGIFGLIELDPYCRIKGIG